MTKIVLFNGPPSSGKDTIASQMAIRTPKSLVVKFAGPLKSIACDIYCGGNRQVFHEYDQPHRKNIPEDIF